MFVLMTSLKKAKGGNQMSVEKNKAIIRRSYEEYSKGDFTKIDEVYSADCLYVNTNERGIEATKQMLVSAYNAFSDASLTIEDMVAEGDKVWVIDPPRIFWTQNRKT